MLIKKKRLKLMSLAIICFLLIGMYTPINNITALAADAGNVVSIINSTFEDDDSTVWAVNGGGTTTLTRTTTEAQAGIKSLAVTKRTLAYQGPRVDVLGKIAAGTTYTTSVWVKFSGTGTKEFKVTLNSTTDSYKNMIDTFVPANTWTQITGTYTTSTSATPITSALVYVQCMDTTLDYNIDNFSITTNAPSTGGSGSTGTGDSGSSGSGSTGTGDSSGSGGTGSSGSGTSGSGSTDSGSSGSGTSTTTSSAVLINSTFEADDTTVWEVNGGGTTTLTRTTTEAQAGIKSLAVTKRTQTYQGPRVDVLGKIAAGTTYTTTVWVKFSGTETKTFKVTLNSTTDSNKNMIDASVPANEWTQITGTYTTSTSATPITSAKVFVQCMDATLDYYIDNFSITKGTSSSGSGSSGSGTGSTGGSTGSSGSGTGSSGGSGSSGSGSSGSGSGGSGGSSTGKTANLIESDSTDSSNKVTNNSSVSENTQAVENGWKLNGYNKWTFINNEGKATGWNLINNKWYVFDSYGQMKTGWFKEAANEKWYFLNSSGEMKTGWMHDADGKWYFLKNSGDMKIGWMHDVDGKWYFLNDNGEMLSNTNVNGYILGSDGAWIQ